MTEGLPTVRTRNILLLLEYDGRAFAGFQAQRRGVGLPTVQETLAVAIRRVSGEQPRLVAAGRTDSGVHALGQVVNFLTGVRIPPERWAAALNSHLPATVRVWHSQEVPLRFHARYDAYSKLYRYRLNWGVPVPGALEVGRVWAMPHVLDVEAMARAARCFAGRPCLRAFCAAGGKPVRDWHRRIDRCEFLPDPASDRETEPQPPQAVPATQAAQAGGSGGERVRLVRPAGQFWSLWVEAEGFLYHQVRTMMGTLVEVGLGKRSPEAIAQLLSDPAFGRERAGPTAPAGGLYLVSVCYPAEALGSATAGSTQPAGRGRGVSG